MDSLATAEAALAEAVRRDPSDAYAQLWLGTVRTKAGRTAEALGPLREATRLAPRLTEAHIELADALSLRGDWRATVGALETAVRQDPVRHPGAWNDLGFAHLQLGEVEAAQNAFRRAVALDPREPTARVNLGTTLLTEGDLAAAAAQFEAALRSDPRNVPALGNLGMVRAQQGRTDDARALFTRLLQITPNDPRALAALRGLSASP